MTQLVHLSLMAAWMTMWHSGYFTTIRITTIRNAFDTTGLGNRCNTESRQRTSSPPGACRPGWDPESAQFVPVWSVVHRAKTRVPPCSMGLPVHSTRIVTSHRRERRLDASTASIRIATRFVSQQTIIQIWNSAEMN